YHNVWKGRKLMAIEEHLPPACAFAVSVLQEREIDPDEVPEEAVEAAQQHLATCIRCLSSPPVIASPRKKRRVRRQGEEPGRAPVEQQGREPAPLSREPPGVTVTLEEAVPTAAPQTGYPQEPPPRTAPATRTVSTSASEPPSQRALTAQTLPAVLESADGPFDCAQCRQLLP